MIISPQKRDNMRYVFLILLSLSTGVFAQSSHEHSYNSVNKNAWVAPAVVGSAMAYELFRPSTPPPALRNTRHIPRWVDGQPVTIYKYGSSPQMDAVPAYNIDNLAFCQPGMVLWVRMTPHAFENVGCAYQ